MTYLQRLIAHLDGLPPFYRALLTLGQWMILAGTVEVLLRRVVMRLAERTSSHLDDILVQKMRWPIFFSVLLFGVQPVLQELLPDSTWVASTENLLLSLAIILWTVALTRSAEVLVEYGASRGGVLSIVNRRTQPIFDLAAKGVLLLGGVYFLMLAWEINVTGWLASAGVIGIAIGFAAQETLGNLFAGIFILTDAPYKLGDYLILEDGTRGRVTDIGLRSTRMLTNDGIEITLPNQEMANSRVTNESGGPFERARVRVLIEVGYGTDLAHARGVLLRAAAEVRHFQHADATLQPFVRWRAFNASGIEAEVVGWVLRSEDRESARNDAIVAVYDALNAAGIEIPFATHTVHLVSGGDADPS